MKTKVMAIRTVRDIGSRNNKTDVTKIDREINSG